MSEIHSQTASTPLVPLIPIATFTEVLDRELAESRSSLKPFSVFLVRVLDRAADLQGASAVSLGLHLMACLRAKQEADFPNRKLDLGAWWEDSFVVLCPGLKATQALIPANRLVDRIEDSTPLLGNDGDLKIQTVFWSWSWRRSQQSAMSILQQLQGEVEAMGQPRIMLVPEQLSPLEKKLSKVLDILGPDYWS